ncbi:MAG: hypothetical protein SFT68_00890 [Rickettsiaceae bacterium]|nr:hypothetical protein [Rickettsiaceae bacterium]
MQINSSLSKDCYINLGLAVAGDLVKDINLNLVKKVIIIGVFSENLAKLFANFDINIVFYLNYQECSKEDKCDLLISFLDIPKIYEINEFMGKAKEILSPEGIFAGCFAGELTMIQTRMKLWAIEEKVENGYTNRMRPSIRLADLNSLLHYFGLKNIISFKDEYNIGPYNIQDYFKHIRDCSENIYIGSEVNKPPKISKNLYKEIMDDVEVYNDKIDIIGFCASSSTRFFAARKDL